MSSEAGGGDKPSSEIIYPSWGATVEIAMNAEAAAAYPAQPGVKMAFEGRLDRALFLYAVQIAEQNGEKVVSVLWPERGSTVVPAGPTRVPPLGAWLEPTARGHLRLVASTRNLSVSEIAKELGGREPPPGAANTKGA